MEEKRPSQESTITSLADLDFTKIPLGEDLKKRPDKFLDPRIVSEHFQPLLKNIPTPEEHWREKEHATAFPGL